MKRTSLLLPPDELVELIGRECALPVSDDLQVLVDGLVSRFGNSLIGVLLYGSCLRTNDFSEGLVDLYALVDDYANVRTGRLQRIADAALPPTVFVMNAITPAGVTLRAKCALITLDDFERGASTWFHSYIWGRFSQPARLLFAPDLRMRKRIHSALGVCVIRMISEALGDESDTFTSASLWERALNLTYRTELRPEKTDRSAQIVRYDAGYYRQVTHAAAGAISGLQPLAQRQDSFFWPGTAKPHGTRAARWKLRRAVGRTLNVLRLMKSFYTFENGVDYIIWKLERHLGEPVEVSPNLRRFPFIFCWPLLWRLLKSRQLR